MLLATLGGGAAAGAGVMAWAVRSPRSSVLAPSVFQGAPGRHSIALTFDDGPSESTEELLELLGRHRAPATFFQCGANVRRLPEVSRQVALAGHEIGNHTDSHPMLSLRPGRFIFEELERAQLAIEGAAGVKPRLFRPPYGVRWFGLRSAQRRLGLNGVMWSVNACDWKLKADSMAARVASKVRAGAIVLLHDGRDLCVRPDISDTIEAVRRLLPQWVDQGYEFETVSQILCPTN